MNYTDLTANINEECEYTFTADQIKLFVQQTEKFIYQTVEFPVLRATDTGATVASTRTITLPADFNWAYNLVVVDGTGRRTSLLNKDTTFLYEAFPDSTAEGLPRYYALATDTTATLGPIPDTAYNYELEYSRFPESIVTANTTWLGDTFDNALLNGSLVEAARFLKQEPDIIQNYNNMFQQAIAALKNMGDGKLRQDTYRSGQFRTPAL